MSITAIRQAFANSAMLMCLASPPAFAITGGVSVDEVLGSQRASPELQAMATAVSAVTVILEMADAQNRSRGYCSGTLIHPRVVLTAAHCVFDGRQTHPNMRVVFPDGSARPQQRQVLDVEVHASFVEIARRQFDPNREDLKVFMKRRGGDFLMSDLALVLLHRPAPETHAVVEMVAPGFRDDRGIRKVIAGYGRTGVSATPTALDLRFADLRGNTRDYQGAVSGGTEIVMEAYYRDGEKVNVCSGDSGGPVLILERGGHVLRQIAVTSAADVRCASFAIFAPIDAQRGRLRQMFDRLMQGERGAAENPF